MKSIWKLLAVITVAGGLAACNKDKGPEGPTDFPADAKQLTWGSA